MPAERGRPAWNILLVDDEDDVIEVSRMEIDGDKEQTDLAADRLGR